MKYELKIDFLETGRLLFPKQDDGYIHRKKVPFLIVAQAYEGHYEITVGTRRELVLSEGEAFVAPSNTDLTIRHRINPATGRMKIRFMHIRATAWNCTDLCDLIELPEKLTANECRTAIRFLRDCEKADRFPDPLLRETAATAAAMNMLVFLLNRSIPLLRNEESFPEALNTLRPALDAMGNPEKNFRIPELAKRCAMSRAGFYRLFSRTFHCSPAEYVLKQKIRKAAMLFQRNPECSIKETAETCGFSNQFHFSRKFKEQTGISPTAFLANLLRERSSRR